MRLYLKLTKNIQPISFNYQPYLTGALHKWIGNGNDIHDSLSLYSFSWLQNVDVIIGKGIMLKKDSYFFISAYDDGLIKKIIRGILADPILFLGIHITDVKVQNNPVFSAKEKFLAASPVLIKRRFDGKEKHVIYDDADTGKFLTETIKKKAILAEVDSEGFNISFDREFLTPKSKVIYYNDIGNRVSICPVIIEGSPEQVTFAWNVGVGNSTGIGFGALK